MTTSDMSNAQLMFIKKHIREKRLIRLYQLLILIGFIGLWQLSASLEWIDPFIFSSPSRVVKTIIDMTKSGKLFYHLGITLFETLVSFVIGTVLGIIIAMILWWFKKVSKTLEPYLVVLNSMPKTALAPILIVWLGNNMKSILFTAVSLSIIVTILNIYTGFCQVDSEKLKLITTFGGKRSHMLTKVVIPANYANIVNVMKVNIGLSLIGVIIGEFLAAKAGLGYLIIYGSQTFKLDWVMMSMILLALLATLFYEGITLLEKHLFH